MDSSAHVHNQFTASSVLTRVTYASSAADLVSWLPVCVYYLPFHIEMHTPIWQPHDTAQLAHHKLHIIVCDTVAHFIHVR